MTELINFKFTNKPLQSLMQVLPLRQTMLFILGGEFMFRWVTVSLVVLLSLGCVPDSGSKDPAEKGSAARGGDWSGGGGENFGVHQNPWFLENKENVYYCIISSEDFGSIGINSFLRPC